MALVRRFLTVEAAAFALAAMIHAGLFFSGYAHRAARNAESLIALVLLAGLAWASWRPQSARRAGLAAQTFALLLTFVGITTIVIGVGPQTAVDLVYHVAIVVVLLTGLVLTARSRAPQLPVG